MSLSFLMCLYSSIFGLTYAVKTRDNDLDIQDRYLMPGAGSSGKSVFEDNEIRRAAKIKKIDQLEHSLTHKTNHLSEMKPRDTHVNETYYVHLIPHTHDDVGWIKTIDQYFSGTGQESQHAAVRLIIDNVVDELLKDPKRRFTYVEMKYFTMWYNRQP